MHYAGQTVVPKQNMLPATLYFDDADSPGSGILAKPGKSTQLLFREIFKQAPTPRQHDRAHIEEPRIIPGVSSGANDS